MIKYHHYIVEREQFYKRTRKRHAGDKHNERWRKVWGHSRAYRQRNYIFFLPGLLKNY